MIKSKTEYMQAKLLALAFQRRFYGNGDRHPFYDCAVTELTYYLDAVSDLHGNRLGQKIARNFRKFLNEEPEEKRERKTYVLPLSQNQAYRIAEEIIKNDRLLEFSIPSVVIIKSVFSGRSSSLAYL